MPANKWSKRDPMRMTSPSLKGRGRWAQVLNVHVVGVVPILQLLLVAPLVKVTVPAPSKIMNRMTTTMTMKTSPWTLSRNFNKYKIIIYDTQARPNHDYHINNTR
jgi:hypothetical protein